MLILLHLTTKTEALDELQATNRHSISVLLRASFSMSQIARILWVHRSTLSLEVRRNSGQKASLLTQTLVEMLKPFKDRVLTITADNGKEFTRHQSIAKELDALFYFAHPYHSWEKGLNENTNGLIRQYFPKKTDSNNVDTERIIHVQNALKHRLRKTLDFRKPAQLFTNSSVAPAT